MRFLGDHVSDSCHRFRWEFLSFSGQVWQSQLDTGCVDIVESAPLTETVMADKTCPYRSFAQKSTLTSPSRGKESPFPWWEGPEPVLAKAGRRVIRISIISILHLWRSFFHDKIHAKHLFINANFPIFQFYISFPLILAFLTTPLSISIAGSRRKLIFIIYSLCVIIMQQKVCLSKRVEQTPVAECALQNC